MKFAGLSEADEFYASVIFDKSLQLEMPAGTQSSFLKDSSFTGQNRTSLMYSTVSIIF